MGYNVNRCVTITIVCLLVLMVSLISIIVPAKASNDVWVEKASMPFPEGDFGAVSVNGTVYVIGSNYTANSAFNYLYNPSTDTWTSKTPMPITQGSYALAACQGKIYAFGGTIVNNVTIASTLVYDPTIDSWTTKSIMPTPRLQMQANMVNGKIYLIGGVTFNGGSQGSVLNVNEAYDPSNDSWTEIAPAPIPVEGYTSTVFGNKIYVIGGYTSSGGYGGVSTSIIIYDTLTSSWSYGKSLPTLGQSFTLGMTAAATLGIFAPARIYLVGGNSANFAAENLTLIYDPIGDNWIGVAPMPQPRAGVAIAVVNDTLYVIGGTDTRMLQQTILFTTNEQYIPSNYALSTPTLTPASTPSLISEPKPFSAIWVLSGIVIIATVAAGLLVCSKKRKH